MVSQIGQIGENINITNKKGAGVGAGAGAGAGSGAGVGAEAGSCSYAMLLFEKLGSKSGHQANFMTSAV